MLRRKSRIGSENCKTDPHTASYVHPPLPECACIASVSDFEECVDGRVARKNLSQGFVKARNSASFQSMHPISQQCKARQIFDVCPSPIAASRHAYV